MNDPTRVEQIFCAALERGTPPERAAYLDEACANDGELRRLVERLLAAHPHAEGFLESPAADCIESSHAVTSDHNSVPAPTSDESLRTPTFAGARIGPYELLRQLGEGGMGTVYLAEQQQPIKRCVALKIVKIGMDSTQVIARFEQERQALAMMDHPNIARVLDGGMTQGSDPHGEFTMGRPYFVMELVNGRPLNQFCDESKLGIRERLELFVPICQAVQHAHQKGIVHRDLKPSNILVTVVDGRPIPKVIDFGVAKATGGKLTDDTLATSFGAVVGTLEYMSPEQAGQLGSDVDTRADVYSLGVILYELLTGLRPFDQQRLKRVALDEMMRMIREDEPSKPSTRLSTNDSLPSLAARRQIEPERLTRMLRGELDCVVMKCLEKQRDRRYESASGLARDVQRFLADEIVEARPPSLRYRTQKFLRRNRWPVAAVAMLATILIGASVVSATLATWAVRAERQMRIERDDKNIALTASEVSRKAEQSATVVAQRRLDQVERGVELLARVFDDVNPKSIAFSGKPLTTLLADRLQQAADNLWNDAVADPTQAARLQVWLGVAQINLGFPDRAEKLLVQAVRHFERELDHDDSQLLIARGDLAWVYSEQGRFREAIELVEEIVRRQIVVLGSSHRETLNSQDLLARCYYAVGRMPESQALHESILQGRITELGTDHPHTWMTRNNIATTYLALRQSDAAATMFRQVLQYCEKTAGSEHSITLVARGNLALAVEALGQSAEAASLQELNLRLCQQTNGADHPDTLTARNNLAGTYESLGRLDDALGLYEQNLQLAESKLPAMHPSLLQIRANLASVYWKLRRLDKSIPLYERAWREQRTVLGDEHPETLRTQANLAVNYRDSGRMPEALPLLQQAYERSRRYPALSWVRGALAATYEQADRAAEAELLHREAASESANQLGPTHSKTIIAQALLARCLLVQKKFDEAEPVIRQCLAVREQNEPDAWTTYNTRSLLGGALLGQKLYAEAETQLRQGFEGMKQREKSIPPQGLIRLTEALERLVQLCDETDQKEEAARLRQELEARKQEK